jgi:hypothetical protein
MKIKIIRRILIKIIAKNKQNAKVGMKEIKQFKSLQ